jgi:hypothetical protein
MNLVNQPAATAGNYLIEVGRKLSHSNSKYRLENGVLVQGDDFKVDKIFTVACMPSRTLVRTSHEAGVVERGEAFERRVNSSII